jgi:hypothetical protein
MLEKLLSTLGLVVTLLGFVVGFVGFYQLTKFHDEWQQDHAGTMGVWTRSRLSTTAIFSSSLSERCRWRRRRVLLVVAVFVGLLIIQGLLTWVLRKMTGV